MPDSKLQAGLSQAKTAAKSAALHFAFVMKGGKDGALMVSKGKVPTGLIDDAKKRTGGSAVLIGRCFGEKGILTFEMTKAPGANVKAALQTVIKRDAAMTLSVNARAETKDEEKESEESESEEVNARPGELLKLWRKTVGLVDARVKPLVDALRKIDNRAMTEAANAMEGAIDAFGPHLEKAFQSFDNCVDPKAKRKAYETAKKLVDNVRAQVNSNKALQAAEDNPFDINVNVIKIVGDGLNDIQKSLDSQI